MTTITQVPQDLHLHTIYSTGDSSIVRAQTPEFISSIAHAGIIGIADHLNYVSGSDFNAYALDIRSFGFKVGVEVSGAEWVQAALAIEPDYYVYHCWDKKQDYKGIQDILTKGKPLIVAHPLFLGTDLEKVPRECFVEINNRYIWQSDWKRGLTPFLDKFSFVISSDAHQPHWLNQNIARFVAHQLGIEETILF